MGSPGTDDEETERPMDLKPGMKLYSATCDAEFVVVRAGTGSADLGCGGAPLSTEAVVADARTEPDTALGDGALVGKRYADDEVGLELLCSRGGAGAPTLDGAPLGLKGAKPLPASD